MNQNQNKADGSGVPFVKLMPISGITYVSTKSGFPNTSIAPIIASKSGNRIPWQTSGQAPIFMSHKPQLFNRKSLLTFQNIAL